MPPCFAWMRRPPFKRSTVATASCRCLPEPERHGFEYKRNGTLSLYAALNTKTGQVHGKTAARSCLFPAILPMWNGYNPFVGGFYHTTSRSEPQSREINDKEGRSDKIRACQRQRRQERQDPQQHR